ncbi:MAG: DUF4399 domain-containing protein [Spirochaetota bacterium]
MKKLHLLLPMLLIAAASCKKKEYTGKVWFSEPSDKAEVTSPVKFVMQVEGMTIKPAGTMEEGTGHFHILIDKEAIAEGQPIINDEVHKHYGKGQTEDTIELKPGDYRITLQFADGAHVSYGSKWSQTISLKVKAPAGAAEEE